MVKVLCIGDLHFKVSEAQQIDIFIKKVCEIINQQKPDFVVVLGDILDSYNIYNEVSLNQAVKFLRLLSSKVLTFLLIGNHDYPNNSQFLSNKHAFNALKYWGDNMVIVDTVQIYEIGEERSDRTFTFYFVPYVPPGRFKEALDSSEEIWENADCIFAHQEFRGCKMGAAISQIGDEWEESFPIVISGHIHEAQSVNDNIFYTGSALQQGYSNEEKKLCMLKFKKNKDEETELDMEDVDLGLARKKLVSIDVDNIDNFINKLEKDPELKKHDIKLSIKGTNSKFKAFKKTSTYKNLVKKGIKLSFNPEIIASKNELSALIKSQNYTYGSKYPEVLRLLVDRTENEGIINEYKSIVDSVV